jgi:SIR2-like domain
MHTPNSIVALQTMIARGSKSKATPLPIESSELLVAVNDALKQQRLTVFLGAGISYASGFPTWSGLLSKLSDSLIDPTVRDAFDFIASYDSPLVIARYLKTQLHVESAFHMDVRNALYANPIDLEASNPTLEFIVAIIERAYKLDVRLDLITYNFDDLLERTLRKRFPALNFDSISTDRELNCALNNVRIFHVHGYLPSGDSVLRVLPPPSIVLSEDDFHRLMNDPWSWANRVQSDAFRWRHCLFVGLSMADPNLRRVLDYSTPTEQLDFQSNRWIVSRRYEEGSKLTPEGPPMNEATAKALNGIKASLFASLGARVHEIQSFSNLGELADKFKVMC